MEKDKNALGYRKGTHRDLYCAMLLEGKYTAKEILAAVQKKFGKASRNSFNFFLRDLRISGHTVKTRNVIKLVPKQ